MLEQDNTLTNRNPNIVISYPAHGEPFKTTMQQLLESATSDGNANKFINGSFGFGLTSFVLLHRLPTEDLRMLVNGH